MIAVAALVSLLVPEECEADFELQQAGDEHPSYLVIREQAAGLIRDGTDVVVLIPAEIHPDGYSLELSSGIHVGFRSEFCSSGGSWAAIGYPSQTQFRCEPVAHVPDAPATFEPLAVTYVSWVVDQPNVLAGFDQSGALVAIRASDELASGSASELRTWRVETAGLARIRSVLMGCPVNVSNGSS